MASPGKKSNKDKPVRAKGASKKTSGRDRNEHKKTHAAPGNKRPHNNAGKKPTASRASNSQSASNGKQQNSARSRGKKSTKDELIRLNKFIAHAGVCSRREADTLIKTGLIQVNGKLVTELGTKVHPDDEVKYHGEQIGNERKVYLLLNKPKDYVTTVDDPHARKTVMNLVGKACKERIYPVGRLDRNTTGVLLFTNDGDLTRRLTHPSFNKKKIYHAYLDKGLSQTDLNKIAEGLVLDDGPVTVDAIAYAHKEKKNEVGIEIHSGRNRVVRRIFESFGYEVTKLDRVYFAGLTKKNLPRGRHRFLTDKEIKMLKTNAFE
ncbi:MAG TPA: pseudouridine synthase [Bacteroidales bacterium]|nr:pseudouridine synthase [Bacteroidales bacterium]